MRNCDIKIKIGAETISLLNDYDIHILESPAMTVPLIKDYDIQKYPNSAAAEIDPRTTLDPFEYKLTLGYSGQEEGGNEKLRALFDRFFTPEAGDILRAKEVELINEYKGVKMKGYIKQWDGKTYTISEPYIFTGFDFIIHVINPKTFLPHATTV